MANKVAELYADFRVNFQKATLDVLNTTLGELRLGTIAEIASVAGLTRFLYQLGEGAVATATDLHVLSRVYGFNTSELQRMEVAGLAANVSVEKMTSSMTGLQQNLAGLNLGHVSQGFLEAAGFFGLSVHPGMTADQVMSQLFKRVPAFVRAHGAMGRPMAAQLLGEMGMSPDILQYIMAGKKLGKGPIMKDPTVEALTHTSEELSVLSRNVQMLAYKAIAPLIETLLPISAWFLNNAGGVENIKHPVRTLEGLFEAAKGDLRAGFKYMTPAMAKQAAADALALHKGQVPMSGAAPAGLHPGLVSAMLAPRVPSGPFHAETHISVHGVADHKIAHAVKRAAEDAHARQKRDFAMHTAINNPVGQ